MKTLIIGRILAANRVLKRYLLLSVGVPADSVLIVFCLEKKKKKKEGRRHRSDTHYSHE